MFRKNRRMLLQNEATDKSAKHDKKIRRNRRLTIIAGLFLLLGIGIAAVNIHVNNVEKRQSAVIIKKKPSIIFFYKDDCPYCKKVFTSLLAQKDTGANIQLVNLNGKFNHDRYKGDYLINSVPTFVLLNEKGQEVKRYSGSNMKKIQQLINQIKDYE